jgi:hypothetical protein
MALRRQEWRVRRASVGVSVARSTGAVEAMFELGLDAGEPHAYASVGLYK